MLVEQSNNNGSNKKTIIRFELVGHFVFQSRVHARGRGKRIDDTFKRVTLLVGSQFTSHIVYLLSITVVALRLLAPQGFKLSNERASDPLAGWLAGSSSSSTEGRIREPAELGGQQMNLLSAYRPQDLNRFQLTIDFK